MADNSIIKHVPGEIRNKATYNLDKLKEYIRAGHYRFTETAQDEITEHGIDEDDIINGILEMYSSEIYKTAPSFKKNGLMFDVYKAFFGNVGEMYIKLQEYPTNHTLIISVHFGWKI